MRVYYYLSDLVIETLNIRTYRLAEVKIDFTAKLVMFYNFMFMIT